jgi:hypothetical protein
MKRSCSPSPRRQFGAVLAALLGVVGIGLNAWAASPDAVNLETARAELEAGRAIVFEPIASIADAGGPMKMRPASSTARTNSDFSDKKP